MMAVERVTWNETLEKAESIMYPGWSQLFRQAYEQSTPEEVRRGIRSDDLLRIGLIWGASDSNQTDLFSELVRENLDTEDWATIGSIICSPLCDAKTLEHFSRNILREEGYGYLLRVVARNKNVSKATLESIANDPQLALRYTEVAKAALYGGHEKANKQIWDALCLYYN